MAEDDRLYNLQERLLDIVERVLNALFIKAIIEKIGRHF
jgi:hypothetical protein